MIKITNWLSRARTRKGLRPRQMEGYSAANG